MMDFSPAIASAVVVALVNIGALMAIVGRQDRRMDRIETKLDTHLSFHLQKVSSGQ